MATGQNVVYAVTANSNLRKVFAADEAAAISLEKSIAGVNSTLRTMASAAGVGWGLHAVVDWGKSFVQTAADFEVSMLRIKNASDNAAVGIKNQLFIKDQADAFKIQVKEMAESYGEFLFKIKNANLTSDVKNNLFKEIVGVSKVAGLSMEQMSGTIYQTAALLGEGVMVGRNLRQLAMIHPNLMPYIADELGIKDNKKTAFSNTILHENPDKAKDETALQILSQSISHGLTKMGISSLDVMTNAWNRYYEEIKTKVPETLNLIQSGINETVTSWTYFQTELVDKARPELNAFFDTLKDGITWLRSHEDGIIAFGKTIIDLTEVWIAYKVAMGLVNLGNAAFMAVTSLFAGAMVEETVATNGLNAAMIVLNDNLRILIQLQLDAAVGARALTEIEAIEFGQQINRGAMMAGAGASAGAGIAGAGLIATVSSVLATAAIVAAIGFVVDEIGTKNGWFGTTQRHGNKSMGDLINATDWSQSDEAFKDWLLKTDPSTLARVLKHSPEQTAQYNKLMGATKDYGSLEDEQFDNKGKLIGYFTFIKEQEQKHAEFAEFLKNHQYEEVTLIPGVTGSSWFQTVTNKNVFPYLNADAKAAAAKGKGGAGYGYEAPPKDHVTGQHLVTYNILHGGRVIGQQITTQNVNGTQADTELKADDMARLLKAIMQDEQIH